MINKLMKPLVILILILIIIFVVKNILSLKKHNNILEKTYQFKGVVDEVTATSIVVIPDENEDIRRSSDKISMGINKVIYQKGDRVIVTYKDGIAETYPAQINVISIIKEEYSKEVKLYITLIDNIMNQDVELNEDREYLAIDTQSFKQASYKQIKDKKYLDITDNDKTQIINYCAKYSNDIRESSLNDLKKQGLFNEETMSLDGMVVYVKNIEYLSSSKAKIEIVKYVSGTGAVFGTYTLRYVNDNWKITNAEFAIS